MEKNVRTIGWLLLLGQLFFQTSALVVTVAAAFLSGSFEMGTLIGSDLGSFIANIIILGIFWLVKRKDISLTETKSKQPWLLVGGAFVIMILWNCTCSLLDMATNHALSLSSGEMSVLPIGINLIAMAIFPAIVEEFAFRKVIFGVLRKYGFPVAAIFSSVCFGLMHQNFLQIIFATILGMMMCYVYEHTGKLYFCMLLHFLNNAISVVMTYSDVYMKYGVYAEAVIGVIAILVFLIAAGRKKIQWKELLQINEQYTYKDMMAALKRCFTRVPVVIFTIFCIGMAIMVACI